MTDELTTDDGDDIIDVSIQETLGGMRFDITATTPRDYSARVLGGDGGLLWSAGTDDPEATSKFASFGGSIEDGDVIEVLAHAERQGFESADAGTLINDDSRFGGEGTRVFVQVQDGEAVFVENPRDSADEDSEGGEDADAVDRGEGIETGDIDDTDELLRLESQALFDELRDELHDAHGEPVFEDEWMVVFADTHGHELSEIAAHTEGVDRGDVSEWMHRMARKVHDRDHTGGDAWSVADPVVCLKTHDNNPYVEGRR